MNDIQTQDNYYIVFENEIEKYIIMFCDKYSISDLKEITQSVFNALLMFICKEYIKPSKVLKDSKSIYGAYNIPICEKLCDYYLFMCRVYDKEVTLQGFVKLSGIDENTIYEWYSGKGKYKASSQRSEIYKKLSKEREESLSDKLLTGKNPVGVLGILNHFYGWSGVGNMQEDRQKQAATLTDAGSTLFDLSESGRKELCEKQTQL